jgi:hypothetical protein
MKKAGRKSIWDTMESPPRESAGQHGWDTQPVLAGEQQLPEAIPVVEQLRVAEKKSRDRKWEKQPENRPMLFRGIPPGLRSAIKEIAISLNVRVDDVARAFLEFGLQCYRKGEIQVQPVLSDGQRTLFPARDDSWGRNSLPGWYEKVWEQQSPQNKARRNNNAGGIREKTWKWQVSYRGIPGSLQAEIRQIRTEKDVPLGEVATLFLGHALEAFQNGRLVLNPQPKVGSRVQVSTH